MVHNRILIFIAGIFSGALVFGFIVLFCSQKASSVWSVGQELVLRDELAHSAADAYYRKDFERSAEYWRVVLYLYEERAQHKRPEWPIDYPAISLNIGLGTWMGFDPEYWSRASHSQGGSIFYECGMALLYSKQGKEALVIQEFSRAQSAGFKHELQDCLKLGEINFTGAVADHQTEQHLVAPSN